ncbi:LOW QUALITY PROTEIN: rho GTPase-activating protein 29-like [Rhynchocyon petersi]
MVLTASQPHFLLDPFGMLQALQQRSRRRGLGARGASGVWAGQPHVLAAARRPRKAPPLSLADCGVFCPPPRRQPVGAPPGEHIKAGDLSLVLTASQPHFLLDPFGMLQALQQRSGRRGLGAREASVPEGGEQVRRNRGPDRVPGGGRAERHQEDAGLALARGGPFGRCPGGGRTGRLASAVPGPPLPPQRGARLVLRPCRPRGWAVSEYPPAHSFRFPTDLSVSCVVPDASSPRPCSEAEAGSSVNFIEVCEENQNDLFGEVFSSIESLAFTFGNIFTNFLMGDVSSDSLMRLPVSQESKSLENISLGSMDSSNEKENVSPIGLDNMLLTNTDCIELALSYTETWSKYTKNIVSWVENKLTLDLESTRNIVRLAEATRTNIGLQEFMPLQSLFTNALLNDIQSSQLLQETIAALQTNQFVQPLLGSENEMEKQRKEMKELWKEEQNKMIETETALKKAKLLCIQLQDEYEKAKSSMSCAEEETLASSGGLAKNFNKQLEKKRKLEEEALQKVEEANELYKVCVTNVEERRNDLENTKRDVLAQLRTLVFQCDLTLKAVTVNLFYVQHLQAASLANSLQSLCNGAKLYVPGQEYNEFVKATKATTEGEVEGTINQQLARSPQISGHGPASSSEGPPFTKSWTFGMISDSESTGGNSESRFLDSESISPGDFHGKLPRTPSSGTMSSADDRDERKPPSPSEAGPSSLETFNKALVSKSALTHKFRKLRSPRKCRDCDGIVLFQGVECEECLIVCHRKCLQNLVIVCGHQKLMGKIHLFGAEFTKVARKEPDGIPFILKICVSEIESRALCLQGIYRVAGNKMRINKLCQALEKGMHLVATSEFSSHDICDVLKAYLRQLPEPFILFRFYNDCIQLSKELQLVNEDQEMKNNGPEEKKLPGTCSNITRIIVKSKDLLSQLPAPNLNSLSYLLKHLKRVVDHAEANKMHSKNLGLIFGPCLIKPRPTAAPVTISCLSEHSHQARLVEFFLTYTREIFDGCLQPQDVAVGSPAVMAPPADQACLPKLELSAEEREPEHPMKSLLYSFKEII